MLKRNLFKFSLTLLASTLGSALIGPLQAQTSTESKTMPANPKRIAVIYFTKSGHTESVAKAVRAMTGADIYRVETVELYPQEYRPTTEIVKEELEKNVIRPIKPLPIDLTKYQTIILATPTWWHHVAMPLQTWIKSVNLTGKTILTCNTHGGGGIMQTREDFEKLLPKHSLGTHFTTFGAVTQDDTEVRRWLQVNRLL